MFNLKENDIILFQGDSITDGNRGRNSDPNHIHGHGYQYILASEMYADNLNKNIEVINRGISGNRISDLLERWDEDCIKFKPSVLSILIGVNDAHFNFESNAGSTPEQYEDIYRTLLNKATEADPDVFIIIMEPFFGKSKDADYNEYMQSNVCKFAASAKKIAEEYGAVFVPLQDMFDEYAKKTDIFNLLWDGVHPTTGGHQLIVRRWKECVKKRINER